MGLTLREAIDGTLERISFASGVDVQTYAEDPIKAMIQHKFNILFDDAWWPQFYDISTYTLDGSTGVVTTDLTSIIKRFQDVRYVWFNDESNPLPRVPIRLNPSLIKRRSIVSTNQAGKVFKVFPTDTAGTVTVAYRTKPGNFIEETDYIDMDEDLIILGTAYDYLNGIGTNPEEEGKLLQFFNNRLKTLKGAIESGEIHTGSYDSSYISDEWQELN